MTEQDILVDRKAERYVLGCVLHNAEHAMPVLIELECCKDWFSNTTAQEIWQLCQELNDKRRPIDILCVEDLAKKKKLSPAIFEMLEESFSDNFVIAHIKYYVEIIKDLAHKRKQKEILHNGLSKLTSDRGAVEISNDIRFELEHIKYASEKATTEEAIIESIMSRYNAGNEHGFIGIPSRWLSLQRKLGGYKKGKVCLLAARPSKGKTTTALNESRYHGESGYSVGIISLETEEEEIYETMAAEKAGVDLFKMYNGDMNSDNLKKFKAALKEVIKLPIYVTDKSMDIKHIVNWIHFMSMKKKLDIVFIDYVQIISDCPSLHFKSIREKISYYSKEIFKATRDNNIATVLLSQISRGGEIPPNVKTSERWRYVPKLHHLKESGALEEDAYQAVLLYDDPEEGNMQGRLSVPMIFDVAKNKKGPTGTVKMLYHKNKQKIEARSMNC